MFTVYFNIANILFVRSQIIYDGPVQIDYFQQELLSSNAPSLESITCSQDNNEFIATTNESTPVHYYKLIITQDMKDKYGSKFEITTCCKFCDYTYDSLYHAELADVDTNKAQFDKMYNKTYYEEWMDSCNKRQFAAKTSFDLEALSVDNSIMDVVKNNPELTSIYNNNCTGNGSSLDTYLYILQEKRDRIQIWSKSDDVNHLICGDNKEKSYINLLDYDVGEYIIAVGGFAKDYGSYFLQLRCNQYSFPLSGDQLQPYNSDNLKELECGQTYDDEENTETSPISYYEIEITDVDLQRIPISILTCSNFTNEYDSYMYIFKQLSDPNIITTTPEYGIIAQSDDGYAKNHTDECGNYLDSKYILTTAEITETGIYYVAIQGIRSNPGSFSISMECGDIPIPKHIKSSVIKLLLFISMTFVLMVFAVSYHLKLKDYRLKKQKKTTGGCTDTKDEDDKGTSPKSKSDCITPDCDIFTDDEEAIETLQEIPLSVSPPPLIAKTSKALGALSIGRLDEAKSLTEQLEDGEDVVSRCLGHAIQCCDDQNGFDVFQVLAIRWSDDDARKMKGFKPFERLGYDFELVLPAPLLQGIIIVITTILLQTYAFTIIVSGLVDSYFRDLGDDDSICNMEYDRWLSVIHYKILALFSSLVVTFMISSKLQEIQCDGLNKMMNELKTHHVLRVDKIAIWLLPIGQAINYYVCFFAVIGSYFIIFEVNQGEQLIDGTIDYSHSGLDIILNLVALFFMFELDNILVTEQDYLYCANQLRNIQHNYKCDTSINEKYILDCHRVDTDDHKHLDVDDKRYARILNVLYKALNLFAAIVIVICFGSGFVAPFVIFFCW